MGMSKLTPSEQAVVHILYRQLQAAQNLPGVMESDKGRNLGEWAKEIVDAVRDTPIEHEYVNDGRNYASCTCGKWGVRLSDLSNNAERASRFAYRQWENHALQPDPDAHMRRITGEEA